MKLIALCTIVAGKPEAPVHVAPGEEFDIEEAEGKRLVAGGHAKLPEKKAAAEKAAAEKAAAEKAAAEKAAAEKAAAAQGGKP